MSDNLELTAAITTEEPEIAAKLEQLRFLVFQGKKGDTGDSAYDEAVKEGFVGTKAEWLASLHGADGFSPVVSVGDIPGGHSVTIRDAEHTYAFAVMDGVDGERGASGYSPTITVEDITGGHRVTIRDITGAQSFDVMDGEDATGGGSAANAVLYTPQTLTDAQQEQARDNIGIRFMTAADIDEMWGSIDGIPSGDGVSY
jgi:hypothetical protein